MPLKLEWNNESVKQILKKLTAEPEWVCILWLQLTLLWLEGQKEGWKRAEWDSLVSTQRKKYCEARMSMHAMASAYTVTARRAKGRTGENEAGLTCFHTTTCSAQWRCGRTVCTGTPRCRHSTLWVSGLWTRWWRCCHPSAKTTHHLCGPPGYAHTAHNKQSPNLKYCLLCLGLRYKCLTSLACYAQSSNQLFPFFNHLHVLVFSFRYEA